FKKFATLLPNNWLDETPQPLAVRRLGRQSAERERISEIKGNFFRKKPQGNAISSYLSKNKTRVTFIFFTVTLIGYGSLCIQKHTLL
ncbi:hypothetical protein ABKP09_17895, partial [Peribacillus frigoritolerans]|uniref:hypothetical protein n=1 Tax=Peribacillus frigoritolerans TaxID=450367 RepID=UPI0032B32024